jgi:hypothetical protein
MLSMLEIDPQILNFNRPSNSQLHELRLVNVVHLDSAYLEHTVESAQLPVSILPDFSVVLFRPDFMRVSERYPIKTHKNQSVWSLLSSPGVPVKSLTGVQTPLPAVCELSR